MFVIERFDTFDASDLSARLAGGRTTILFPGFQVDLDTGQVVPDGHGGDLVYSTKVENALASTAGATLYVLSKVPARPHEAAPADARRALSYPSTSPAGIACSPMGSGRGRSISRSRARPRSRAGSGPMRTVRRIR